MVSLRRLLAALLLSLMLLGPVAARDIYVSNTAGDDRFTGRSTKSFRDGSGPVRTIGRALRLAGAGDRIVLDPTDQPYRESISLVGSKHGRSALRPFAIVGNGAILDGSAPVPPAAWEHYRGSVFRFRPSHGAYQQLYLEGKPAIRIQSNPLADAPAELEPLEWSLHAGHIYFHVPPGKLPGEYDLRHADLPTGVTLYHVEGVQLIDLVIQGFQLDGLNAVNSARDVQLIGVVTRGNGRNGLTVGAVSGVRLQESVSGDNGHAQLSILPHGRCWLEETKLLDAVAPAVLNDSGHLYGEPEQ